MVHSELPQQWSDNNKDVVYCKLSPFEVSFTDMETKKIYVDRKFMWGGKTLDYILMHERLHQASDQIIDPEVEYIIPKPSILLNIIKKKPLAALASFMPIIFWRNQMGDLEYRVDAFRVGFLILTMMILGFLYIVLF